MFANPNEIDASIHYVPISADERRLAVLFRASIHGLNSRTRLAKGVFVAKLGIVAQATSTESNYEIVSDPRNKTGLKSCRRRLPHSDGGRGNVTRR